MKLNDSDYVNNYAKISDESELISVSERIHKCKDEKRLLEIELSNEELYHKYIFKRKDIASGKMRTYLFFAISFTMLLLFCIIFIIETKKVLGVGNDYNAILALEILFHALPIALIISFCIRLWRSIFKMTPKFYSRRKSDDGISEDRTHYEESYNEEKVHAENKIEMLKLSLKTLNDELDSLYLRQEELVKEKLKRAVSYNYDNDANAQKTSSKDMTETKFRIKKEKLDLDKVNEILCYYDKEIRDYRESIEKLEEEIERINSRILSIDVNYDKVKHHIAIFMLVFIVLFFAQNLFWGIGYIIAGIVIGVFLIVYFFRTVKKISKPIILYLVEHESEYIRDYAFLNNLVPLSFKIKEIRGTMEEYSDRIKKIENDKRKLQNGEIPEYMHISQII